MKTSNWLNLDHHEWVAVDMIDGRRLELNKGDQLIMEVDSITIKRKDGIDFILPAIQVAQIIKKLKDRYL